MATTQDGTIARRAWRWRALVVAAVMLGAVVASQLYYVAGWKSMESACTSRAMLDPSLGRGVSFSWSWSPLGFQCRYDSGDVETSLWFG